ncbi:hypothetical protein [Oceanobacillus chungangensis]|uniref:Uncharacterized protein n=1 Tax=Oceanobacillus chungangensis TaxID=1229152 RepID=A0A3D8PG16_9BACI|nr:hypothetical protein [Oceanobacillus chungangensis]RDW15014.1 hypothetical protein CWR45_19380 [Oceanobacillus chungangensis]
MNQSSLMNIFIESETALLVELRMGKGLDREQYETFISAFSELAGQWEKESSIPSRAVQPIMEIYADLYQFSLNYSDEEAERIREAAQQINKLREQCLSGDGISDRHQDDITRDLIQYIDENNGFFAQMEQGRGMDEEQFEKVFRELTKVHDEITSWEMIPKPLVKILISFYEMDLLVFKYEEAFEMQEEADKIYDAYERVFELIAG